MLVPLVCGFLHKRSSLEQCTINPGVFKREMMDPCSYSSCYRIPTKLRTRIKCMLIYGTSKFDDFRRRDEVSMIFLRLEGRFDIHQGSSEKSVAARSRRHFKSPTRHCSNRASGCRQAWSSENGAHRDLTLPKPMSRRTALQGAAS